MKTTLKRLGLFAGIGVAALMIGCQSSQPAMSGTGAAVMSTVQTKESQTAMTPQ